MNKYQLFYQKMINGKIPFKEKFCILNDDNSTSDYYNTNNKIKIISPTQSSVEKAKSEIRDENDINSDDRLNLNQFGGAAKGGKKKASPKSKTSRKSKPKKKSKSKTTKGVKKQSVKKTKNKKKKAKKEHKRWMSFKIR